MLEQSKKLVHAGVELVNVGSKLIHKKGVFVVFQLSDEAAELSSLDVTALKAEWPVGSIKLNAVELVAVAKKKLDLENKDTQLKIEKFLDLGVKGGELVERGIGLGKEVVSYVQEVKVLFA